MSQNGLVKGDEFEYQASQDIMRTLNMSGLGDNITLSKDVQNFRNRYIVDSSGAFKTADEIRALKTKISDNSAGLGE